MSHKTGTYSKGGKVKVAEDVAQAVALTFEGYRYVDEAVADDTGYRDLQEQAKALGIPAHQSKPDLVDAMAPANGDDRCDQS